VPKLLLPIAIAISALRLMRTHHYVAVHAYQVSQAAGAAMLIQLFRPHTPLIVTIQEGKNLEHQSVLVRFIRSFVLRRANAVTAISGHLAAYARRYSRAAVHIIPNGVDIVALHRPDIVREPHAVVTVSRLVEKNNVANLIRAMMHVCVRIPDARLIIVGEGRLRLPLQSLAVSESVAGCVEFVGSVEHERLGETLSSAGVFARPSLSEGLGSAFLEAMAAGTPVVASAVGGIPDIVRDGETGLMCNPHDPADIARAIVRLMEDNRLREQIAGAALAMVQARYDWSMIAEQMATVYAGLQK
jgi:phenylacetate-CoA ligase